MDVNVEQTVEREEVEFERDFTVIPGWQSPDRSLDRRIPTCVREDEHRVRMCAQDGTSGLDDVLDSFPFDITTDDSDHGRGATKVVLRPQSFDVWEWSLVEGGEVKTVVDQSDLVLRDSLKLPKHVAHVLTGRHHMGGETAHHPIDSNPPGSIIMVERRMVTSVDPLRHPE